MLLLWTSLQLFTTLVRATNRAWGEPPGSGWRLSARGLAILAVTGCAVSLGMAAAALASVWTAWLPTSAVGSGLDTLWGWVLPPVVVFGSLTAIYRLAPRRPKRVAEVWVGAALTTVLLQLAQGAFTVYLARYATLNAVYGVLGGVMALLLWIYLSGCGFVLGACVCWARVEDVRAA